MLSMTCGASLYLITVPGLISLASIVFGLRVEGLVLSEEIQGPQHSTLISQHLRQYCPRRRIDRKSVRQFRERLHDVEQTRWIDRASPFLIIFFVGEFFVSHPLE